MWKRISAICVVLCLRLRKLSEQQRQRRMSDFRAGLSRPDSPTQAPSPNLPWQGAAVISRTYYLAEARTHGIAT